MGNILAGRYQLNECIGSGAMGDVYLAADAQTGGTVAVKALRSDLLRYDPDLLARFQREGEALRELNHPNIVALLDVLSEDEAHYLVMEYVTGGDLAGLLADNPKGLSVERVLSLGLDVADALTRAHRLNIIHRDLKPANVLIAEDGTPRLSDFGVALAVERERLTDIQGIIGTPAYMAPEAISGDEIDTRADVWSLGVMVFEMLVGQRPFRGDTLAGLLASILNDPVPDLLELQPDCPIDLVDLVYRMLEKDPLARIPSVRYVGAVLEDIAYGRTRDRPASRFDTPVADIWVRQKYNLPQQSTPFVGRQREVSELTRLLSDPQVRLVTILGAGGMGKTRLGLEVGAGMLDRFEHGVYFVPLAPLQSAQEVVPAVARAVGFNFSEDGELLDQLLDHLKRQNLLLLLDNIEHLLENPIEAASHRDAKTDEGDVIDLVGEFLNVAPDIKFLVTSRMRLNVQGEHLLHLFGMQVPDGKTAAEVGTYSAVRLFVQSARRVQPNFELQGEGQQHVVGICRLVGGMPLAILLAAAWVELLNSEEIEDEIAGGLGFLETDLRDMPERQRSIRTVFDYSWNLLGRREQAVFAGLSVFRGGFLREAAQAVTGATLRELKALVDKSLLHRTPTGRYEIHELLRQYGWEKLFESGEGSALQQRHLDYYLSLAGQLQELSGQLWVDRLHCLADEIDNLRAALDWCQRSGNAQTGLQLALHLFSLWGNLGYLNERRDWLTRLLAMAPEPTLERARGLQALGHTVYNLGDYSRALNLLEDSLALAETLGDLPTIAESTFKLSWPAAALGNLDRSYALLKRSVALYQQLENHDQEAFVVLVMGELARSEGDLVRAKDIHEQSVDLHRQLEGKKMLSTALFNLACVLIHFGELDRSQELLRESISIDIERGRSIDCHFMGFSFLANARGQPLRAARLLAASDALRAAIGLHIDVGDRLDYEHTLADLRAQLGDAAFEAVWAEGESLSLEQAIALALEEQTEESGLSANG